MHYIPKPNAWLHPIMDFQKVKSEEIKMSNNRIPNAYMGETGTIEVPVDRYNGEEVRENFSDLTPVYIAESNINRWCVINAEYGDVVAIFDNTGIYSPQIEATMYAQEENLKNAGYIKYIPAPLHK